MLAGCYEWVYIAKGKVVAWVQSCTGSKVHEASWFFVWGGSCGLHLWSDLVS